MTDDREVTRLLKEWASGDEAAGNRLMPIVYEDLRRRAAGLFRSEAAGHTLQPTALINEAYAHLVNANVDWRDRTHFVALATRMMRRLLIDHAKASRAVKRGGGAACVTLYDDMVGTGEGEVGAARLLDALTDLRAEDPRKADLIELKYFGGLTTEELAEATGLSTATIGRDLRFARAWLRDALDDAS
jgi:RNA polymerase sigma factor (TIGR02999 family)